MDADHREAKPKGERTAGPSCANMRAMRLAALLALPLAPALFGCSVQPADNGTELANAATPAAPPAAAPPNLPSVAEPLSRRDLLLAVAEAASDHGAGIADPDRQRALDGQPFSVALRFCPGDETAAFRSSFDEEEGVLRLEVRPDLSADSLPAGAIDPARFEAVEGFWLHRPWLLDPACPVRAVESQPAVAAARPPAPAGEARPSPSVGIAQFLDSSSQRSRRRGERAYQLTRKLAQDEVAGPVDLLLEGRVSALPGGRTIVCAGGSTVTPPSCIVSVRLDRVSLRRPDGAVLAEWAGA